MSLSGNVLDLKYKEVFRSAYESAFRTSHLSIDRIMPNLFEDFLSFLEFELGIFDRAPTVKYYEKLINPEIDAPNSMIILRSFIFPILSSFHLAPILLSAWNGHLPNARERLKTINITLIPKQAAGVFVTRAFLGLVKWEWAQFNSDDFEDVPSSAAECKERERVRSALQLSAVSRTTCDDESGRMISQLIGVQRFSEAGLSDEGRRLFNAIGMVVQFPDDERYCENLAHLVKGYTNYLIRLRTRKA